MTPKAPERPRMAAAAVARMPRPRRLGTLKRRSLAHSQDDDRLVACEHVAGEALLVGRAPLAAALEADGRDGVPRGSRSGCEARGWRSARRAASRVSTRTVSFEQQLVA